MNETTAVNSANALWFTSSESIENPTEPALIRVSVGALENRNEWGWDGDQRGMEYFSRNYLWWDTLLDLGQGYGRQLLGRTQ